LARKAVSGVIGGLFVIVLLLASLLVLYAQRQQYLQEFQETKLVLETEGDRAKEVLEFTVGDNYINVTNCWGKPTTLKMMYGLNGDSVVSVQELNVVVYPGQTVQLQKTEGDRHYIVTALGNIFDPFQIQIFTRNPLDNMFNASFQNFPVGGFSTEPVPVRLYVNPDNPKICFVVVGLHYVLEYNTTTGAFIKMFYVDAPKNLEDNPYRAWVYYMHPVIPFYDLSGWASWQMVSFTAEKSRTVYDTSYIFIYKFLCESGGQRVEYISGTSSYSYYIQQVSPQTFGGTAWILMLSATSGSSTNVFYSLVGPQSSNPGAANGLTLSVNPSGTSYATWAIVSFSYPYFIIEKCDLVSGTYVADYYVYKITSGSSATNLPWVLGGSSSPYRRWQSSSSPYPRQTVFTTRDGFFVWRNGSTWRSYNMEVGGYSEQYSYTPSYDVLGWKYTRYGIVLLRWNGFDILDSTLNVVKSVNLPEGYSWYYPLQSYFSNFLRECTDYGYEFFEYQLSFINSNTVLAVLSGSDGLAKIVKLTF
jgi:hypothetical protein